MSGSANVIGVAYEIWRYLAGHPDARDTVGGIERWWLVEGERRFRSEHVQRALELMASRGFLSRQKIGDTVIYGAAEGGLEKMAAWFRDLGYE